jgi:lysozyme
MEELALAIAVDLIKQKEGCRLKAYQDIVGIWTIGYGETKGVKPGDEWTQAYADERIKARVKEFMDGVLKACPQLWLESPNRLAACTSLAYNIGLEAFAGSTVCRMTMAKEYQKAHDAFPLWNKAGGKAIPGLTARRLVEAALYIKE